MALSPKVQRFAELCALYGKGGASRAAREAGYGKAGARVKACNLLKRRDVIAVLDGFKAKHSEKVGVKLERVLEELALIAFIDPKDFYRPDGQLLAVPDMPEHARRALAGIEIDKDGTVKVKFEKRAALAQLLEHLSPPKKLQLENGDGSPLTIQIVKYGSGKC